MGQEHTHLDLCFLTIHGGGVLWDALLSEGSFPAAISLLLSSM